MTPLQASAFRSGVFSFSARRLAEQPSQFKELSVETSLRLMVLPRVLRVRAGSVGIKEFYGTPLVAGDWMKRRESITLGWPARAQRLCAIDRDQWGAGSNSNIE
jgi:hypothetical protein